MFQWVQLEHNYLKGNHNNQKCRTTCNSNLMFCIKQKKAHRNERFQSNSMSSEYCLMEERSSQQINVTSIYNYAVTTPHPLQLHIKPGKSLKTLLQMERKWDRLNKKKFKKKGKSLFWFHLNHSYANNTIIWVDSIDLSNPKLKSQQIHLFHMYLRWKLCAQL